MLQADSKKQLGITLTEPVIFLRSVDPSGRHQPEPNDPPTLVRGIVSLNVVKSIEISSIEVELTGVFTLILPEEIEGRRIELPEKLRIYSSAITVFRADQTPRGRRPVSIGPGLVTPSFNHDEEHAVTSVPRPPALTRECSERRGPVSVLPDLGPSPPYTYSAQPPTSSLPGLEDLSQSLEEPGQTPRSSSEGHVHWNELVEVPSSSSPHSIEFSPPDPTRENDDTLDIVHTRPPPESGTSLSPASRVHPPRNAYETQPPTHGNSHDSSNIPTGRSRLHLSLSSVLDAVKEVASRAPSRSRGATDEERGRTRVRIIGDERGRASSIAVGAGPAGLGNGGQLATISSRSSGNIEHREHHLLGFGRVLGLERDKDKEKGGDQQFKQHGGSWREFDLGTYNYPFSFLLPPNLPPTLSVPRGSLEYTIKAVAHRPGTFTSKLSCQAPIIVVAAPTIGDGEGGDPGPLVIQKQWREQLAYSFGLSSRLFLLGSQRYMGATVSEGNQSLVEGEVETRPEAIPGMVTLDLTLLPLEKVKIWRLGVVVEQWIRYVDERGRLCGDQKKEVKLLEVQHTCSADEMDAVDKEEETQKNKHRKKDESTQIPLFPTPISPHRSPLLRYIPASTDPSVLAGPGPYTLSTSIGLPGCSGRPSDHGLHCTVQQKSSRVRIEHSLRFIMRVEPVDEGANGHEGQDKRRLFDISVQSPITILSCRCAPEYQTLPRYSQITDDSLQNPVACACPPSVVINTEQGHGEEFEFELGPAMSNSTSSFETEDGPGHSHLQVDEQSSGHGHSRSSSRARGSGHPDPLTTTLHFHPPSPASRPHDQGPHGLSLHTQIDYHRHSRPPSNTRAHSQTPISTPRVSRPSTPITRYERLVSGLESEAGDAPPSYESIASDS